MHTKEYRYTKIYYTTGCPEVHNNFITLFSHLWFEISGPNFTGSKYDVVGLV